MASCQYKNVDEVSQITFFIFRKVMNALYANFETRSVAVHVKLSEKSLGKSLPDSHKIPILFEEIWQRQNCLTAVFFSLM